MDVAASEFFREGKYDLDFKNKDSNKDDWVSLTFLLSVARYGVVQYFNLLHTSLYINVVPCRYFYANLEVNIL